MQTISAQYSCDFGGYGSGIAPATVAAGYAVSDPWPVSNPDDILLVTDTLSLPSQVSSQLSGVTDFEVEATVPAEDATAATVTIAGDGTATLPNPPTEIPQITSEGQVIFPALGTGTVALPAVTFVITPFAGTTAMPAITCTTTTAAQNVTITVDNASGPFYECTLTSGGVTQTESVLFDMTFTASGQPTVGATDTVTLSSSDLADLLADLPSGVTVVFAGSLPVQGAQSGSVSLTGTTTTPVSGPLTATGTLQLSTAGSIELLLPQTFTLTVSAQGGSVPIDCTLQTSPAPAALTLSVTQASGGSTTTTGGGTPAGAPATGGGIGAAGGMPAAAGAGAALIAGGGALLLWARRRRAGELLAGGAWRGRRRRSS